jgi:Dolichyl-phosphate-mannose-protein mannosyltransferase
MSYEGLYNESPSIRPCSSPIAGLPAGRPTLMRHRVRLDPLWAVVLLSVALRGAVMVQKSAAFDDPDNYVPLARSVAEGNGFVQRGRPTAYRPPLYPLLLAGLVLKTGEVSYPAIALLHVVLGAGTVWLTAKAARGSGLSNWRANLAAFIVACDPVLLWQSRSVMTETPTAFLLALGFAGLCRPAWQGPLLGGVAFGLAALCRPSVLPGILLTIAGAAIARPGPAVQRVSRAALLAVASLLVLSPWAIRNFLQFGEPIWTTTHGGYTLALANNPVYYQDVLNGPPGRVWTGHDQWLWADSITRETAGMSEPEADRYLRNQALALARRQPVDFARATIGRLGHFWSVAPAASVYSRAARIATLLWTIPLFLALVLGLSQPAVWSWPRVAAPLAIVGLTIVHAFYWTDLRMRAPIVPAIALIASSASSFPRKTENPPQPPSHRS